MIYFFKCRTADEPKEKTDSESELQIISVTGTKPTKETLTSDGNELSRIYSLHAETFAAETDFTHDETVDLRIERCTFEEVTNFMLYEDASIIWKGCTFKKSLYFDCCGKVDFNIQDCKFSENACIYIRKNSSLKFEGNLLFGNFTLVASEKVDLMLKNCEFNNKTRMDLCSETILKCEVNEFAKPVEFNVFGESNATFQRNSFLAKNEISLRGDSVFSFEANDCKGSFYLHCYGKINATVERNSFFTKKMNFLNDAVLRFKTNICHQNGFFKLQGNADVNIAKCMFHESTTLSVYNNDPITLQKNVCAGETIFKDGESIKLVVEKNWFKREEVPKAPISPLQPSENLSIPKTTLDNPLAMVSPRNNSNLTSSNLASSATRFDNRPPSAATLPAKSDASKTQIENSFSALTLSKLPANISQPTAMQSSKANIKFHLNFHSLFNINFIL